MLFPVYLIEAEALDANDNPVTHYWSTHGFITKPTDNPSNQIYLDVVEDPGMFSQSLYSEGQTMGQSVSAYGDIRLSNADGVLDSLVEHAWDGRTVRIKRLESLTSPYSTAVTVLTATAEGLDSSQAWSYFSLRIYDRRRELDRPIQVNRYAGTTVTSDGSINGTSDQKGDIKPLAYGRVRGVEPVSVNPYQWLFQASDSQLTSVVSYDGGSPRTPRGDHASVGAALSASILAGQFNTCMAQGVIRFGGIKPRYVLTCDLTEGSGTANRYPGAIAQRMLSRMGITGSQNVDSASFAALDAAVPSELGIYIDSEETGLSAISRLLASVGAYIIPDSSGRFVVGRLTFGTPSKEITESDIYGVDGQVGLIQNPDTEGNIPTWRVILKYQKLQRALDNSNVAGCVSEEFRNYLCTEWREVVAEDSSIKTRHPLSQELEIETCIDSEANAQTEANRLLSLYGVRRDVLSFEMPILEAPAIGSTVTVILPRWGYGEGRDMIVIARRDEYARDMSRLTLWG